MAKLLARINGVEFVDDLPYRGTGFLISPDGFSGWDDGVDMRREDLGLQAAHGNYALPGYLNARVISISGVAVADSPEDLGHMGSRLTGLLAAGGFARLVVDHQGRTLWADVGLGAQTKFLVRAANPTYADFQVQFVAPDPRLRGERFPEELATYIPGQVLELTNYGNFPAAPTYTIQGGVASAYSVNGPTGQYLVSRPLLSGHVHRIDMRTKRLYDNGVRVTGGIQLANTWLVAGGHTVGAYLQASGGTPTLSGFLLATYM